MSKGPAGSLWRERFPELRKILVSAFTAAVVYLLASLVPDTPQIWAIAIAVFTGGIVLVTLFLLEFDERLTLLGQRTDEHYEDARVTLEDGFARTLTTFKLFGLAEGAALPTETVAELVRHATEILPDPPLVYRFAQHEIGRLSQFLKELGQGGEVSCDGEDRDWLLALTSNVRSTIRATSLPAVDASGFWMSDIGQHYVDIQHEATRRGVTIQRVFILDRAEFARQPAFAQICEWQLEHNIDVRILDPAAIPPPWHVDVILFDETISYETTPVMKSSPESRPAIANTHLVLDQHKVLTRINRFNELWELATPY